MKLGAAFPSKWLKADDCEDGDMVLTISQVGLEDVQGQGAIERKLIVRFHEVEKGLVCNKTNAKTIEKLYGDDTDDWVGKKIALYSTEVEFGGETMLGLRIRLKPPKAAPAKAGTNAKVNLAEPGNIPSDDDEDIPF